MSSDRATPRAPFVRLLEHLETATGVSGVVWSADDTGDLNVNLVQLEPGSTIAAHVNREVDVAIVVVDGTGWLEIDDDVQPLAASVLAVVPKGRRRSVRAGPRGVAYVTVHRRRGALGIRPPPPARA